MGMTPSKLLALILLVSLLSATVSPLLVLHLVKPPPVRASMSYRLLLSKELVESVAAEGESIAFHFDLYYPLKPGSRVARVRLINVEAEAKAYIMVGSRLVNCTLPCTVEYRLDLPFTTLKGFVLILNASGVGKPPLLHVEVEAR